MEEEFRGHMPQEGGMMVQDRSLLVQVTDPAKQLEELEQQLRGNHFNPIKQRWEPARAPMANEEGIGHVLLDLRARLTQNTILCNLDKHQVSRMQIEDCKRVGILLVENAERFGIRFEDVPTVHMLMTQPTCSALNRSLEGGERRFISKVATESHNVNQHVMPKRGLLDGIMSRGK